MARPDTPTWTDCAACRACVRWGWTLVAVFLAMGLFLEFLHLIKAPFYVDVRLRRELWTLAHAHGTLLALVTVVFGYGAHRLIPRADARARAGGFLRWGVLLVPVGFLLGGIANTEGDPSLFIVLVPVGAIVAFVGVAAAARGAWGVKGKDAAQR